MKNSPTAAVSTVHGRVQHILESAQNHAARSVNTAQVVANWLIGREIVEEQQSGAKRAGYGEKLIPRLALQLRDDGVPGYGNITLKLCRQFYLAFPHLPGPGIGYALRNQSKGSTGRAKIGYAVRNQLPTPAAGQSAQAGCLMSYGGDLEGMFRYAATYVDKIFKGRKPEDLPVEQPTRIELVINGKTAKALGLAIPHALLISADRVIE